MNFIEEAWYGSGSGSGDGTGENIDDNDDSEDDEGDGSTQPEEGSGYGKSLNSGTIPDIPNPQIPINRSGDIPVLPIDESDRKPKPNNNKTVPAIESGGDGSGGGTSSTQKMSLSRALTTYLFPIAVMWFGGCLTEWL